VKVVVAAVANRLAFGRGKELRHFGKKGKCIVVYYFKNHIET
jgi:hypothetical protein